MYKKGMSGNVSMKESRTEGEYHINLTLSSHLIKREWKRWEGDNFLGFRIKKKKKVKNRTIMVELQKKNNSTHPTSRGTVEKEI